MSRNETVGVPDVSVQQQKFRYMTPEWFDHATSLRDRRDDLSPPTRSIRLNIVVTEVPHRSDGVVDCHLDSSGTEVDHELGHLPDPDATLTIRYETAKAAFVDRNFKVALRDMFLGRATVKGNRGALMSLQMLEFDQAAEELLQDVRAMTVL